MRKLLTRLSLGAALAAAVMVVGPSAQNTLDASMPISKNVTMEQVLAMNHDQILALWRTLPPVPFDEFKGHYSGLIPNAGDKAEQARTTDYFYNENSSRGYWLGKAFKVTGPGTGEGYNRWRFPHGRIEKNLKFATRIGRSLIDGKPAYILDYSVYNNSTLYDEMRKLDEYVYLGMATTRRPDGTRTDPAHFLLVGPTDDWVGGVPGAARPSTAPQ